MSPSGVPPKAYHMSPGCGDGGMKILNIVDEQMWIWGVLVFNTTTEPYTYFSICASVVPQSQPRFNNVGHCVKTLLLQAE